MDDTALTTLRRKAGAGRPRPDFGLVSPVSALRLAVSKAGQDVLRVRLSVGDVKELRLTRSAMADSLPDSGLWVVLRAPGGAAGIAAMDAGLLSAVLQAVTSGRLSEGPVPRRPSTQTDAIMVRPFMAGVLDGFGAGLAAHPSARWAAGFQPRDRLADGAGLVHAVADVEFHALSADIDIGSGLCAGRLDIVLPHVPGRDDAMEAPVRLEPSERDAWQSTFRAHVMESEAVLEAVLHRFELPLAELSRLAPDMVLPLPAASLDLVRMEDREGGCAAMARLGRMDGRRAVKLLAPRALDLMPGQGVEQSPAADRQDPPSKESDSASVAVQPNSVPPTSGDDTP